MKIGLILPGFSASESDWCIPVQLHLVRELSRRAEVHVFPLRYPHHSRAYRVHQAQVQPLGGADIRGPRRLGLLQRAIGAVVAEHRRERFDVLHGVWADEPGFVAVAAARRFRVPAVVSLVGGELIRLPEIGYGGQLSPLNRWLVRTSLNGAAAVTAGSDYMARLAAGVEPARLRRLVFGVDTDLFQPGAAGPSPLHGDGVKLLHVGSLVPVKDQRTLLDAMRQIVAARTDVHLHLVGDGPERARLQTQAQQLGIADRVSFHGAVSHDRLPDYYRAADLCIMSSRHEAQELATLEAGACGRTTVGTAVGLLPDVAPADQVVPVGDASALAGAVLNLFARPCQPARRGHQTRQVIEQRYSLRRTLLDLDELYGSMTAIRRKRV